MTERDLCAAYPKAKLTRKIESARWLYQIIHHNPHEIPSGHVQDHKHDGRDDIGCPKGVSPLQIAKNGPSLRNSSSVEQL